MPPLSPPEGVTSASLTDAVARLHPTHTAHVLDLVSPTPGRVLFGVAATMAFVPLRADVDKERASFVRHLRTAVGESAAGKVVVMACPAVPEGAVAGGKRLAHLEAMGVAGLLSDARLRDFHEVREYGFVAYCRGETVRAGSKMIMPVASGVPVALGGATVFPGDYVYADAAGAVVIPAADLDRVLAEALAIEAKDAAERAEVLGKGKRGG